MLSKIFGKLPLRIWAVIGSGVFILLSLFALSPRLIGWAFLLFYVSCGYNVYCDFKSRGLTLQDFNDHNMKVYNGTSFKKEPIKCATFWLVGPMMAIGFMITVLMILTLILNIGGK